MESAQAIYNRQQFWYTCEMKMGAYRMKLIHTSDWHFGIGHGTVSYAEDQRYFLNSLYDLIRREQVGAVLLAGDVYDSSVTNAEAISLYNEAVTMICKDLGIPMIVIAGNHDSAPRLASCRELLKASGLHVTGRLERDISPVLLDGGKVAVYPLPFFGKEEVTALYPEEQEKVRSQETAVQVVCNHIREHMDPNRCNIILSHSLIVAAELSESDRSAKVGFATAVSKDVFEGFDYVALGHIHKPQVIAPHIRYSGSPLKYSFGSEEQQEKGVVLLDTETLEQRFVPIAPFHDRKSVEGTYEEILAREDIREEYLRIRLHDRYAGLELLTELRLRFPNLLELYGMELQGGGGESSLCAEELERLDEVDIMSKFLQESFGTAPEDRQLSLFRDVLAWSREEGELG